MEVVDFYKEKHERERETETAGYLSVRLGNRLHFWSEYQPQEKNEETNMDGRRGQELRR